MHATEALPVPNSITSFWRDELHEIDDFRCTETLPETSDIVMVGAGYSGVASAYHLLDTGSKASMTLIEARGACSGATGRNGGHLRPDYYGHIPGYIKRFGIEAGVEITEFEIAHMKAIKDAIDEEKIRGWRRRAAIPR